MTTDADVVEPDLSNGDITGELAALARVLEGDGHDALARLVREGVATINKLRSDMAAAVKAEREACAVVADREQVSQTDASNAAKALNDMPAFYKANNAWWSAYRIAVGIRNRSTP